MKFIACQLGFFGWQPSVFAGTHPFNQLGIAELVEPAFCILGEAGLLDGGDSSSPASAELIGVGNFCNLSVTTTVTPLIGMSAPVSNGGRLRRLL